MTVGKMDGRENGNTWMTSKHFNTGNISSYREICVLKYRNSWERQQLTEMCCGVESTPRRPLPGKEALES